MHHVIHIAWSWATRPENRFTDFLLLWGLAAGLVVLGTGAYDAWKADLAWLGWDLRHRRPWRHSDREPH
jgi:hypothetical protein